MWVVHLAAAFFMGALSGMGIGGGGLLVIYLTLFCYVEQLTAQGINLYFFLFAAAASLAYHKRKRNIPYNTVLMLAAAGLPATYLGSTLAADTPPELLRTLFGSMLVLAGGISLFRGAMGYIREKRNKEK